MASSLLKFSAEHRMSVEDGRKLFWGHVGNGGDGFPFRGTSAPLLKEDEWDSRVAKVADANNAFFDVADPKENKKFLSIMDRCYNGWFQLVHLERFWVDTDGRRTTKHYVEWVEYYLEDGTGTSPPTGMMELPHG